MDSMTLYRGMDIGTAKPTAERAPAGAASPDRRARPVGVGQRRLVAGAGGRRAVADIEARGQRVLFVGGTPLYLKALLHGLFDGPPADAGLARHGWTQEARAARAGRPARTGWPRSIRRRRRRLHPNDLRRVIRALEVWELTGRPISAWQTAVATRPTTEPARSARLLARPAARRAVRPHRPPRAGR